MVKAAVVLQHSYCRLSRRSAFKWYALGALEYRLFTSRVHYLAHASEKKELAYASASRVSRNRESAVNAWVKEIKSICQVKGQPEIIHPIKSQSKYLVSQSLGRRSEYTIYRSASPLRRNYNTRSHIFHTE